MNQSINTDNKNSKEPQQKYRLGTVSIKILGGLKPVLAVQHLRFRKSGLFLNPRMVKMTATEMSKTIVAIIRFVI